MAGAVCIRFVGSGGAHAIHLPERTVGLNFLDWARSKYGYGDINLVNAVLYCKTYVDNPTIWINWDGSSWPLSYLHDMHGVDGHYEAVCVGGWGWLNDYVYIDAYKHPSGEIDPVYTVDYQRILDEVWVGGGKSVTYWRGFNYR